MAFRPGLAAPRDISGRVVKTDHERLQELFLGASERSGEEREAYLNEACADHPQLRAELDGLLAADTESGNFLADTALREHVSWLGGDDPSEPVPVPERVANYRVRGVLGEGGMGIVYLAEQESPHRDVALKVLRPGHLNANQLARLAGEAELLGRLQHPGIAQIFEAGTFGGGDELRPFFAMERIEGVPLLEHAGRADLDRDARIELFLKIIAAVQHAHQRGVVHRDLKPSNILVDHRGQPKVLDFGVSATTDKAADSGAASTPGGLAGTLSYMAPEQVRGEPGSVDPRVDVYALGVILYQLLSNHLPIPIEGRSATGMMLAVVQESPRPLSEVAPKLPEDLQWITDRALAKSPEERYESPVALGSDLRRFLAREPIHARPPTKPYLVRCFLQRNGPVVALGVLLLVVVSVSGAVVVVKSVEAASNARQAQAQAARLDQVRGFLTGKILGLFDPGSGLGAAANVNADLEFLLRDAEESLCATPRDLALVLRDIGATHANRWELDQAQLVYERALALGRAEFGDYDPYCLGIGNRLALVLRDQDKKDEALTLIEDLLAGATLQHGPSHPEVLRLHHNRALLHKDHGHLEQAESEYREVLAARTELLGAEDPATLSTRAALAEVLVSQGRSLEALAELETVLEAQRRVLDAPRTARGLGPAPGTLITMEQVADLYRELGRYGDAEPLLREAANERVARFGRLHDDTLAGLYKLARTLIDKGAPGEGEQVLRETLASSLELHGPDHLSTAFLRAELARALRLQGRLAQAEEQATLAHQVREARYPAGHPALGFGQVELGRIQLAAGRAQEALVTYDAALETLGQSLQGDNWHLAVIRAGRAGVLHALGRDREARPILERAITQIKAAVGPDHERLADLRRDLLEVYRALELKDLAAGLRAQLALE
jgi:eukaryotic-like serine/threonine-protein kinase